jgi:hypothetical protein
MKSRVHPTYKTKYRVENWQAYEWALVQRGDVTLWLSRSLLKNPSNWDRQTFDRVLP